MLEPYGEWSSYETWVVNLWLTSNQEQREYWRVMAQAALVEAEKARTARGKEEARGALSESLKEWLEDNNPLVDQPGLYANLLEAAIEQVDCDEIAVRLLDGCEGSQEEKTGE